MVLVVQILPLTRLFCNVHLFRVPHSWTDSVQMKPSMAFIQGNMCIERERKFYEPRSKTFKGVHTSVNANYSINDPIPNSSLVVKKMFSAETQLNTSKY